MIYSSICKLSIVNKQGNTLPTPLAPSPTILADRGNANAGVVANTINNDAYSNGTDDIVAIFKTKSNKECSNLNIDFVDRNDMQL